MKLTVVVPVYNVEKYIEKCLFSVLDNDIAESDYEIIVVDDETPDNSLAITEKIVAAHTNVKVISQKNKGLGGARNTGIENASGDYLLFLDADDWVLPNTLSHLIAVAEKHDVDVLEFAAQGVNPQGKITYHAQNDTHGKMFDGVYYYNHVRYLNSACNKLYKAKFLKDSGLFFKEKIFIEDFEFNTRAFYQAKKVIAIPFLAAQFLQSDDSITRNRSADRKVKMYRDFIDIIRITDDESKKHHPKNKEQQAFFNERLSFLVTTLFFQFFKYKMPYAEIRDYIIELKAAGLYHVDFPVYDKKKDLFRKVMLKHAWLFSISQPVMQWLK